MNQGGGEVLFNKGTQKTGYPYVEEYILIHISQNELKTLTQNIVNTKTSRGNQV